MITAITINGKLNRIICLWFVSYIEKVSDKSINRQILNISYVEYFYVRTVEKHSDFAK